MNKPTTFLLSTLLAAAAAIAAVPPDTVHFQGVLRGADGTPVEGNRDMVFRFHTADVAGDEILVDTHDAVNGNPVAVDVGLFSVALGGGIVTDGTGPGTYATLAGVFLDHDEVWMSIAVNGETLSPRIRVHSSAYAHTAGNVGGKAAADLIDASAEAQSKAGPLGVRALDLDGVGSPPSIDFSLDGIATGGITADFESVRVFGNSIGDDLLLFPSGSRADGGIEVRGRGSNDYRAGNGYHYFYNMWNGANDVVAQLHPNGDLLLDGMLNAAAVDVGAGLLTDGVAGGELYGGPASSSDLSLFASRTSPTLGAIRIEGGGTLSLETGGGAVTFKNAADGDILGHFYINRDFVTRGSRIAFGTPGEDSRLEFGAGVLTLDLSEGRFEFSEPLAVAGVLRVGTDAGTILPYSFVGPAGSPAAESGAMDASDDLYVAGDLEAQTYWGDAFRSSADIFGFDGIDNRFNAASQHRVMVDSDNSTTANFAGWYHDGVYGNETLLARLQESGNLQLRGTLSQNVAFDVAESFLAAEPLSPGDVVSVDPARPDAVRRSRGEADASVIGVVSTRPGVLLGSAPFDVAALRATWGDAVADGFAATFPALREALLASDPDLAANEDDLVSAALERYWSRTSVAVALAGRVPVRVDGSYGAIEPGDYLAPSARPGVARKATGPGPILGTALEPYAGGEGTVLALVHRGHYGGEAAAPAASGTEVPVEEAPVEPLVPEVVAGTVQVDAVETDDPPGDGEGDAVAIVRFERLPAAEPVEAGEVVVVAADAPGSFCRSRIAADTTAVGVAVEAPDDPRPGTVAVAMWGVVAVKVDAGFGAVRPGDLLTTSPTPGHAMLAHEAIPGTIVGKALESLDGGIGTVKMLVTIR